MYERNHEPTAYHRPTTPSELDVSWLPPEPGHVANEEATGFRVEELERFEPPVPLSAFTPCVHGAACLAVSGPTRFPGRFATTI